MENNFLERLNNEILVCQGANATNLISKGLDISRSPARWLIDHPKEVEEHVREFVDAGSDIILCSSAGANRFHLKKYGLEDKVADFNLEMARLWREITPRDRFLVATLYSTGQLIEPVGEAAFEEIYDSYREQMARLGRNRGTPMNLCASLRYHCLIYYGYSNNIPGELMEKNP